MKIAYVFLNGELLGNEKYYLDFFAEHKGDFFCADGGYRHAEKLKINLLELWGDMDSLGSEKLSELKKNSKIIFREFSCEKDFTDGEAIIKYLAEEKKYEKIYVVGGLGGEFDHEITNINLLQKYHNIIFLTEREQIFYTEKNMKFENKKGRTISFIPISPTVENISLVGFKYPLTNEKLFVGDGRAIRNILENDVAFATYNFGDLICVLKNK